jgi:hypothetical protein
VIDLDNLLACLQLNQKELAVLRWGISTVQDYDKTKAETNALDVGEILKGRI